jgi:hypothetical protein
MNIYYVCCPEIALPEPALTNPLVQLVSNGL